jgi:hypothetical protein
MEEIRTWLNCGRKYDEGVMLYLQYGKDQQLKRLFTIEEESDFKRKKLVDALQLLIKGTPVPPPQVKPAVVIQKTFDNPSKWPQQMDEVVNALFQQWKPMFAERNDLFIRLWTPARAGYESEAGRIAHQILDLDDEIDLIYEKRDQYLKHGTLVEEKKPKKWVVDPIKQAVKLKNHERYARDFRAKLKKNPANVKAAEKLKEHEEAITYYKLQLKIDV